MRAVMEYRLVWGPLIPLSVPYGDGYRLVPSGACCPLRVERRRDGEWETLEERMVAFPDAERLVRELSWRREERRMVAAHRPFALDAAMARASRPPVVA